MSAQNSIFKGISFGQQHFFRVKIITIKRQSFTSGIAGNYVTNFEVLAILITGTLINLWRFVAPVKKIYS